MKFIGLLFFFIPALMSGQMVVTSQVDLPVFRENQSEIRSPWTGGINAAQISMFDADYDGENDDIFLFDKAGNRILIFTGETINGQRIYAYRPELESNFPHLRSWALMRDYDCDGKIDIFTYSPIGGAFAVYQNTSTASGLSFELVTESILSEYHFTTNQFITNIYVSSQDIPAIFDFEGDGDLDIMTFAVGGSLVELHINFSVELTGACGLADFKLKNRCYGRFAEGGSGNGIITEPSIVSALCNFNVVDPRSVHHDPITGSNRHIGSTLLVFDANQDALPDIVIGDVSFHNLVYLENSDRGDVLVDSIVSVIANFPENFGAPAVDLENFPAAYYEDISGDGVRDLIASVNNPNVAQNFQSVWYYKNTGMDNLPIFEFVKNDFLQAETIDYGEGSAPALFDYNSDGLMDLVIGSRGIYTGSASFEPALSLYLNTGTSTSPEFTLEDPDWLNVSDIGLGQYVYPTFGDIDADGDTDMVVGDASGGVFVFTNSAGAGNISVFAIPEALSADGETIDAGQSSTPQLFDLNQDALLDLIVGERNGNLNYYQNTGTPTQAEFTSITDSLGGVLTIAPNYFVGNSSAMFYRFENTTYLVAGSEAGILFQYDGIDGNLEGDFDLMSANAFHINVGSQSKPFVYDINTDGLPDVFCGSIGGGVQLFMGDYLVGINRVASAKNRLSIYPNPAGSYLNYVLPENNNHASTHYKIYAINGKCVASGMDISGQIDVNDLPKGLYLVLITTDTANYLGKFMKE